MTASPGTARVTRSRPSPELEGQRRYTWDTTRGASRLFDKRARRRSVVRRADGVTPRLLGQLSDQGRARQPLQETVLPEADPVPAHAVQEPEEENSLSMSGVEPAELK